MLNEEALNLSTPPKLAPTTPAGANPRQGQAAEAQAKERELIVSWLVNEAEHMIPDDSRDLTTLLAFFIHNNAHHAPLRA